MNTHHFLRKRDKTRRFGVDVCKACINSVEWEESRVNHHQAFTFGWSENIISKQQTNSSSVYLCFLNIVQFSISQKAAVTGWWWAIGIVVYALNICTHKIILPLFFSDSNLRVNLLSLIAFLFHYQDFLK